MAQPLFNDYLIHFCGKDKTARRAQGVLESILRRRVFIPSACPLFDDPSGELERRKLQAHAQMVCFTDLRFQDLDQHIAKFGPYGIAIRKDSPPARRCAPVHYVEPGSLAQRTSQQLSEGIKYLQELQRRGKLDRNWNFPRQLKQFDDLRVASLQDIKTRIENEWRFVPLEEGEVLKFGPRDVRFVLVQTWDQAVRWNRRLNSPRRRHLYPYGRAGVLAIPTELLVQSPDESENGH